MYLTKKVIVSFSADGLLSLHWQENIYMCVAMQDTVHAMHCVAILADVGM
jgi:hypothetical protein